MSINTLAHCSRLALSLALSALLTLPAPLVAQAQQVQSFSGRATVIRATVLGISTVISDTGPLPGSGGALEASLLEASVPGLAAARVAHASTVGQGNASRSEASVADLSLTVGGNSIAADFLMARALAACTNSGPTASGTSEIAGLTINGQAVTVTGQPNQTIALPGGRVVINEQQSSADNKSADITVNALHVIIDGVADVVISSAHADVACTGPPACPGGDFVTGGGWINTPSGARGNFGVAGGIKNGAFWGHLVYIDHGTGLKVKGTGVTMYQVTGPTSRHIEGTAEVNGQPGFTYQVDVADNGEPGRNDTFALGLSNGYKAGGTLQGGNIQLHSPCK
jgi:hypothetical protein